MFARFAALAAFSVLAMAPAVAQPSFSCSAPRLNRVERAICSDVTLSRLDESMAALYRRAISEVPDRWRTVLDTEQKKWLRTQRDACAGEGSTQAVLSCVDAETTVRIRRLEGWVKLQRKPD